MTTQKPKDLEKYNQAKAEAIYWLYWCMGPEFAVWALSIFQQEEDKLRNDK